MNLTIESAAPTKDPAPKSDQEKSLIEKYGLRVCTNRVVGVEFLCNPDWKIDMSSEASLIVISANPDVSLIIAKIPSRFRFLAQIQSADFLELKQYANGFVKEQTKLANQDAIMVKALSQDTPPKRLLDYFFIKDSMLYTVLFSVNPQEKWDDYKLLIKTIAQSIELLDNTD